MALHSGENKGSIQKNFIMSSILAISSVVFPFISFRYVSRILLPEGTGKVTLAVSVVSYFLLFAQLGIPTYGIRACAKVRDDREKLTRTAQELLYINLFMCVLVYAVFGLALAFVPKMREEKLLYLVVCPTILLTSLGMEWLFKALEQYTYITVRSIIFKFIALLSMFLLIHVQKDYIIYAGISLFASSASYVMNLFHAKKYIDLKPLGHFDFRQHYKPIMVFFAMTCATTIYTHLDTVMLGFMKTDVDVGYYNAAVKIKTILLGIVTSLGTVLLPRASYYIQSGRYDDFYKISGKALSFVTLFATPVMLYFILFAREGILLISSDSFEGSILPMQIIMPTLLWIGLTNILGLQMLVPLGREKVVLYSEIAGAVVDVALNAILIPRYASAGAAVGTLVAEIVVFVVQYAALRGEVRDMFKGMHYLRICIALALAVAASFWIKTLHWGYFVTLVCSACLYFGVYAAFLLWRREPMAVEVEQQALGKVGSIIKRFKK